MTHKTLNLLKPNCDKTSAMLRQRKFADFSMTRVYIKAFVTFDSKDDIKVYLRACVTFDSKGRVPLCKNHQPADNQILIETGCVKNRSRCHCTDSVFPWSRLDMELGHCAGLPHRRVIWVTYAA